MCLQVLSPHYAHHYFRNNLHLGWVIRHRSLLHTATTQTSTQHSVTCSPQKTADDLHCMTSQHVDCQVLFEAAAFFVVDWNIWSAASLLYVELCLPGSALLQHWTQEH